MTVADSRTDQTWIDAFERRSDYIPLIVGPKCPGQPSRDALWKDTAAATAQAVKALAPKAAAGGDWIPSINIGVFQCITIPSCYGAAVCELKGSEPICHPRFDSIDAAVAAGVPTLEGPVIDDLFAVQDAALAALPEGWHLSLPASASPWDLAQVLMGEEFLVAAMLQPDETAAFLDNLTTAFIELTRRVKQRMNQPDNRYVTNRGCLIPGYRLPSDAIVNFSPDLLRRFLPPVIGRIAEAFGPVVMHFCTKPAPSGHVLPVLTEIDGVLAVDNWQGPDVFIGPDAPARMQSRVGVIGDLDLTTPEKMDEVLAWPPVRDVPRAGGRPLAFNTWAPSVDDARRIYDDWRRRF